ncbi:wall-associated receptor kinase-like 1 [Castanea sativa]|uniref:wall-associated receptor kinase-like 1 n=1 Tax=Castanea sativa TaxID=21020 RepID=UPI003F65367E
MNFRRLLRLRLHPDEYLVQLSWPFTEEKRIKMEKAMQVFEAKEEYFIRNGAILLEKQISCNQGIDIETIRVFSAKDILQATNNYDPDLILGTEIATVYKGKLDDSHKNVLRLNGCCLETEIPMLVFELISNSTLFDNLHGKGKWVPRLISWLDRVRIAMASYAICYMHCGRSRPIVHLDIKSSSIFLDESFSAKLSKFGFAVSIAPGEDFFKCDVYSFGVVLVEVLTDRKPSEMLIRRMNLVDDFVSSMEENCVLQIVDDVVLSQGSNEEIQAFSELALRCAKNQGDKRLTIKEVTLKLMEFKSSISPFLLHYILHK